MRGFSYSYRLITTAIYSYLLISTTIYLQLQSHIYCDLLVYTHIYCYLLTVADAAVAGAVAGADPAPSLALFLQLARVPAILGALTQLPWE